MSAVVDEKNKIGILLPSESGELCKVEDKILL